MKKSLPSEIIQAWESLFLEHRKYGIEVPDAVVWENKPEEYQHDQPSKCLTYVFFDKCITFGDL